MITIEGFLGGVLNVTAFYGIDVGTELRDVCFAFKSSGGWQGVEARNVTCLKCGEFAFKRGKSSSSGLACLALVMPVGLPDLVPVVTAVGLLV